MKRNTSHPAYNEAAELLCLLPIEPTTATTEDLHADIPTLSNNHGQALGGRLGTLRERYGIEFTFTPDGIAIAARSAAEARRIGDVYYDAVYGKN